MAEILAAPIRWFLERISVDIDRDFSRYDGYIDDQPVLYLRDNGNRKATVTLPLQPRRQDNGQSEFETRTEFGDWFTQGDFSRGMSQRFYHRPSRDDAKYLHAEGYDISEPGILRHLNSAGGVDGSNLVDPVSIAEFDDLPFVAQDESVWVGPSAVFGTWTEEDPQDGEVAADVLDLTSNGDLLFAAIGVNGVHTRTDAGVWAHYQPDGALDLDTGDTRVVRWLKDRLMVIGDAGRSIYEVVADSTPTAIETIPAGWEFTGMFEAGPFIFATAVSATAGLSRVHAYGLNSAGAVIEKKSSTPMPKGTLIYAGCGAQGRIFLGGGRLNKNDGKNACLFEAVANDTGELQILLVQAENDTDAADLAVRTFEVLEDSIVLGWGRGNSSVFGRFVGTARYNLARNAFSLYIQQNAPASDKGIDDLINFRDRLLFAVDGGGLKAEIVGTPVATAYIVTSVADWNTTSRKVWDLFEISHNALAVGHTVTIEYTKKNPDEEDWQDALESVVPGSTGTSVRIPDVESRTMALKITTTPNATTGPELTAFGVRSMPAPADTEWRIVRTVRVLDEDRKDSKAEKVYQDPRVLRAQLQDLAHTFVTLYEPGITFIGYVEDVAEVEPGNAAVSETAGTSEREAYYVELRMVARRAA